MAHIKYSLATSNTSDLPIPYRQPLPFPNTFKTEYEGMVLVWEYALDSDTWRIPQNALNAFLEVYGTYTSANAYPEIFGDVHHGYQIWIPEWKATKLGLKDIREGN